MPKTTATNRVLDARPDRVSYRDRMYQPKLASLPKRFPDLEFIKTRLEDYKHLVLDQGDEGACTGFGLAAVINYLLWRKSLELKPPPKVTQVSPRMLHQMARFYDEWPGEDYDGSSCRGAMKGWYRHGVCSDEIWPYRNSHGEAVFVKPKPGWQQDAASRPLGAYYRVRKESITDMQSALCEVGALYVSVRYHDGWDRVGLKQKTPPVIRLRGKASGGHAFALVGYDEHGFIIQNSWGPKWGFNGFGILTYEDWAMHSLDAWVAVLGAPMVVADSHPAANARARSEVGLVGVAAKPLSMPVKSRKSSIKRLEPADAYEHTVVLGNNGHPMNRFLDIETASKAVRDCVQVLPAKWLKAKRARKIVVFAQGGLTTEEAAMHRIQIMAPYFMANGIYPLFITWRAGFRETLAQMIDHAVRDYLIPQTAIIQLGMDPARMGVALGLDPDEPHALFAGSVQSQESRDQSVEVACHDLLVRPMWMQMKRNAYAATKTGGALAEIATNLQKLKNVHRNLEIHLVGHSAGAILLGHLLKVIAPKRMHVASCTLLGPACTVGFACDYFMPPINKDVIKRKNFHVEVLSDLREKDDMIGPYHKSLLYLVSRGMEDTHGMPILGMEKAWDEERWPADLEPRHVKELKTWRKFCRGGRHSVQQNLVVNRAKNFSAARGKRRIPASHLDFDRDIAVITRTLTRIRGRKLQVPVLDLNG